MIESFLESWSLFGTTYLVAACVALVLSLVGVWVVARDQVFLGAAVAQASTLGVALALVAGAAALGPGLAVTFSVATAWAAGRAGDSGGETADGIVGWVFLAAASLPMLLLARDAHGTEEVERLLFSGLLTATTLDLAVAGALAIGTVGLTLAARDRLLLFCSDPHMAAALGLRPGPWNLLLAGWLGVAIGLSIRSAGALYAFGCLVLPALVARQLCRESRQMLWATPAIAVAAVVVGQFAAHAGDLPPAHLTVAILAAALPLTWGLRVLMTRR